MNDTSDVRDVRDVMRFLLAQHDKLQRMAREINAPMAVGWQTNDDTGEDEIGYCPLSHVGQAFVHTVITTVQP